MIYLITMGPDGKSMSVRTAEEAPEELEEGVVLYDSGEEPVEIQRFIEKNGDIVPMTAEDRDAEIAEMAIPAAARSNRMQRNMLLMESDWTQIPDSALSDDDKAAWSAYRTLLRDLPTTSAWPMLEADDWPDAP